MTPVRPLSRQILRRSAAGVLAEVVVEVSLIVVAGRELMRMAVGALGAGTPPRPYAPEAAAAGAAVEPESTVTTPGR